MIARELTKMHQEYIRGSAAAIAEHIGEPKGEITVVLGPEYTSLMANDQFKGASALAEAVTRFAQLTDLGRSRRQAMAEAAKAAGLPVRVVYAAVEAAKKYGE
jgi:16S rRNA (cytidine1402-2'-O)-methyltransferase